MNVYLTDDHEVCDVQLRAMAAARDASVVEAERLRAALQRIEKMTCACLEVITVARAALGPCWTPSDDIIDLAPGAALVPDGMKEPQ